MPSCCSSKVRPCTYSTPHTCANRPPVYRSQVFHHRRHPRTPGTLGQSRAHVRSVRAFEASLLSPCSAGRVHPTCVRERKARLDTGRGAAGSHRCRNGGAKKGRRRRCWGTYSALLKVQLTPVSAVGRAKSQVRGSQGHDTGLSDARRRIHRLWRGRRRAGSGRHVSEW